MKKFLPIIMFYIFLAACGPKNSNMSDEEYAQSVLSIEHTVDSYVLQQKELEPADGGLRLEGDMQIALGDMTSPVIKQITDVLESIRYFKEAVAVVSEINDNLTSLKEKLDDGIDVSDELMKIIGQCEKLSNLDAPDDMGAVAASINSLSAEMSNFCSQYLEAVNENREYDAAKMLAVIEAMNRLLQSVHRYGNS